MQLQGKEEKEDEKQIGKVIRKNQWQHVLINSRIKVIKIIFRRLLLKFLFV